MRRSVAEALRDTVAEISQMNHVVGDLVELNTIDLACLDLLDRHGPMGPRALAERAKVHPATMTGVVDRLERAGWIRRSPDPTDRRRVVLEVERGAGAQILRMYAPMNKALQRIMAAYSVDELETVLSFLTATRDAGHDVTAVLAEPSD